ncbi:MAG: hypothetical protein KIT67_15595 [Alphaproteobacteria bacterium]|nr:hypothetical protein [Alphaproteobacteria bacterium]
MNYPKIGNEIDNLGTAMLAADYSHRHTWRCWATTAIEAVLLMLFFAVIILLCAALQ